jgi:hypothetical protein
MFLRHEASDNLLILTTENWSDVSPFAHARQIKISSRRARKKAPPERVAPPLFSNRRPILPLHSNNYFLPRSSS